MKKFVLFLLVVLVLLPLRVGSQVLPGDKLGWDQAAPSLAEAQGYTYRTTLNGEQPQTVLVTCTGAASPFVCTTPFPAVTPGVQRTVTITASNAAGTSDPSPAFSFRVEVVPAVPQGLRIIRGS